VVPTDIQHGPEVLQRFKVAHEPLVKALFSFENMENHALLEILSFATSHYAIGMQLIVVCNYLGHVCNYKFGIV
jgi:hypothetical protein